MSLNHQDSPPCDNIGQSPGCDPKSTKRNSGLFAFLKWFKPSHASSSSRESIDDTDIQNSQSSSCDSLNSTLSNGTVASFSYINPNNYLNNNRIPNKCIILGPETDTYKARLKQRDKRRENDRNLTLRKKYNLFFNRETLLKTVKQQEEESSRSLPLIMTRTTDEEQQQQKAHRRTNSESSKTKKAGAYLHVKGKRRAPQPPGLKATTTTTTADTSTMSLRRKKRLAPPPPQSTNIEKIFKQELQVEIISNDSLKLDHGILKPVKETCSPNDQNNTTTETTNSPNTSARSSFVEAPVSPRPWYKRNTSQSNANKKEQNSITTITTNHENKYEPIERLPEVSFMRNSIIDLTTTDESPIVMKKKQEEKRKSGMSFLTNISELDREASEIIKKEQQKSTTTTTGNNVQEIPQFMRPKDEPKINIDSWVSPKRRSAKDLIAKFNAITNVTKVTVFGQSKEMKRDYFGKRVNDDHRKQQQENLLESHRKRIEQIDQKKSLNQPTPAALMKSESTSAIKPPKETPKFERKAWNCPKCLAENEYWRIICHVCSTIKPYFDDLDTTTTPTTVALKTNKEVEEKPTETNNPEKILERSKTQIGFSVLANYNRNKKIEKTVSVDEKSAQKEIENKNEERERLKKMLIEMKNSLPNRKSNILMKQNSRASVIVENPDNDDDKPEETAEKIENPQTSEKTAEILIATSETIYENIKVKRVDNPKPIKVSSAVQTQIVKNTNNEASKLQNNNSEASKLILKKTEEVKGKKPLEQAIKIDPPVVLTSDPQEKRGNNFELMRPKDFENIYSDPNGQSPARIYANLARNDELSLFFNMPKQFNQIKTSLSQSNDRTKDTIEVNRLLKRLETAIAKGELVEASNYAKELAQLKVNCSVIRQKPTTAIQKKQGFTIEMYVEDKISHRGPFPIEVTANQTVAELKQQVEQEFEIPANVQRWILGKELASDDRATLKDHNITTEGCPVFLYLVAPDIKPVKIEKSDQGASTSKAPDHMPKIVDVIPKIVENVENKRRSLIEAIPSTSATIEEDLDDYDSKTLKPEPKQWECHLCTLLNPVTSNVCAVCATVRQKDSKKLVKKRAPQPQDAATYQQLVNLDNTVLVENSEPFECLICFLTIERGEGVTLRECLHQFCKTCLAYTIEYNEDAEIKCPYRDEQYSCNIALQDREIKALVTPEIYEQYLTKSVKEAENKIGKSFHCKTPDCRGWCIFEDNVNEFRCPVCRRINCLTCQAIHSGLNCKQYQERMNQASEIDEDAKRTKEMVDEMVRKGEALTCPTCQVILMKKWGCDWVRCSMCKTEICWVTRGPRWGPGGKGDTSGGCQCGVNGVKCHPQCNYCH